MFDASSLPDLICKDSEYGENNFPAFPDEVPTVVAADPGWERQWVKTKTQLAEGLPSTDAWDTKRKR